MTEEFALQTIWQISNICDLELWIQWHTSALKPPFEFKCPRLPLCQIWTPLGKVWKRRSCCEQEATDGWMDSTYPTIFFFKMCGYKKNKDDALDESLFKTSSFFVMTLFELVFCKTWDGMAKDEINRGSNMRAHILSNLLNELWKK